MEPGQVDGGGLLVAGGDSAPLFEAVDASLDGVALLVRLAVECRWPASAAAAAEPVTPLVRWDRDHCPDSTSSQVFADGSGGVRLIGKDYIGPGAGTSNKAGNAYSCHHADEGGRVTGLPRCDHEGQRPTVAIGSKVDLCRQPASGTADGVVGGLVGRSPFLRAPAACWCALTTVESTETTQFRFSSASARASKALNTRCQVPSIAQFRSRL